MPPSRKKRAASPRTNRSNEKAISNSRFDIPNSDIRAGDPLADQLIEHHSILTMDQPGGPRSFLGIPLLEPAHGNAQKDSRFASGRPGCFTSPDDPMTR